MVMLRWITIALMRKTFKNKVNSLRTNKLVFALKITKTKVFTSMCNNLNFGKMDY